LITAITISLLSLIWQYFSSPRHWLFDLLAITVIFRRSILKRFACLLYISRHLRYRLFTLEAGAVFEDVSLIKARAPAFPRLRFRASTPNNAYADKFHACTLLPSHHGALLPERLSSNTPMRLLPA